MAITTLQSHFRSISLPSRRIQNSTDFETEIQKLKSLQISTSSESIQSGLLLLAGLYNSVQTLTAENHDHDPKSVEELLSTSVELLDSCSAIRELFQMIKENVQELQSAFRRKKGGDSTLQNDVDSYFCFRKRMSKCAAKTMKKLKNLDQQIKNNNINRSSSLRELTVAAIEVFRGIVVFLSWPPAVRQGGWSLVSKLVMKKSGVFPTGVVNEIGSVDFALSSFMRGNGSPRVHLDHDQVQKVLQNLDDIVEGFEGGLERLFRELVRSRVALLNILTDH